jgi:WD40 repeat protein
VSLHTAKIRTLQIVRDQQLVVCGGYDRCLKAWSPSDGKPVATFLIDAAVLAAASDRTGKITIADDAFGCAHFLRLENRS